jgi:ZIP family zinc transporter
MTPGVVQSSVRERVPTWLLYAAPLIVLAGLIAVFALGNPLAAFTANVPPVEKLSFEPVRVVPDGFRVTVVNGGPDPVRVAQVQVDDAYYQFTLEPSTAIPRYGRAELRVAYPWVANEPHAIKLLTSSGLSFEAEVELATLTPRPGLREFGAYGLLGVYVGILPVGLGMLWYPAMKRLGRRGLGSVLALTIGLLVFLLIDTLLEALETAQDLPGFLQGVPLVVFSALGAWLLLLAVGNMGRSGGTTRGLHLAVLIAFGIGLHNLGEGLAIGSAFALGEAALGSFLVIGFTLHNITEGVGIAAPLLPSAGRSGLSQDAKKGPPLSSFIGLTLLAGTPAILGAWAGGFAFSPLLAVIFLGLGLGAIWQVIVEVTRLLGRYAEQEGEPLFTWINVSGFLFGLAIMYLTAYLVSF